MKIETTIENAINSATFSAKYFLALSLLMRQSSFYIAFSQAHCPENTALFDEILTLILCNSSRLPLKKIERLIDKICPDTNDFAGDLEATISVNVCNIMTEFARFLKEKDDASIHSIIYWHLEITEFLILTQENLNQNDSEITSKIENHENYLKEKHDILRFLGQ